MKTTVTTEMKSLQVRHETPSYHVSNPLAQNPLAAISRSILESRILIQLASLISLILGEKTSVAQSIRLLNAIMASLCTLLLGGYSWLIQLVLLLWMGIAIWQCHQNNENEG